MYLVGAVLFFALIAACGLLWRHFNQPTAEDLAFLMPEAAVEMPVEEPISDDEIVVEQSKRNVFELSNGDADAVFTKASVQEEEATISDFNAQQDVILIEVDDPTAVDVVAQVVTQDGLLLTLSNDLTVTLPQITTELPIEAISFVSPDVDEAA